MSTPHIGAENGAIAEKILLPGDPLRARFIAEEFLEDPVCYNTVRGMLGYTGTYRGKKVSVQGTGMGIPSISIYIEEMMRFFGVRTLIRVGTCGAMRPEIRLRNVVAATASSTDSSVNRLRFGGMDFAPTAAFDLLIAAWEKSRELNIDLKPGPVFTSDTFYGEDPDWWKIWADYGCLCADMETTALYTLAAKHGARALSLLTVSDSIVSSESCTPEERQTTFREMMKLALEII